jgi:transcriptional regulator with XRE-family HTH domain
VELARALGFTSTGAISRVENGLRGLMFELIINAAKVLEVHPAVLLTPNVMNTDDMKTISEMFRLFEKYQESPDQVSFRIEEIRKVLRRTNYDMQQSGPPAI